MKKKIFSQKRVQTVIGGLLSAIMINSSALATEEIAITEETTAVEETTTTVEIHCTIFDIWNLLDEVDYENRFW